MKAKFWLGIIISIIFLYLFFRKVDFHGLWDALREVNYLYLIPVLLFNSLGFIIRAERWKYLLNPVKRIGIMSLFSATIIGFAANNLLPARLGEIVRAYVIGRKENISKSSAFATIVVERFFDGLMVILFIFFLLTFFPFSEGDTRGRLRGAGIILSLTFIGGILFMVLLKYQTARIIKSIDRFLSPLPERFSEKVLDILRSFSDGLGVIRHGRSIVLIFIYSLIIWILSIIAIYSLLPAFAIKGLPLVASMFILVAVSFGVAIPSAPGYVGTFHFACAAGLILLGVDSNVAKSFALVLWAISVIPITLSGLYLLWRDNLSLKEIETQSKI